MFAMSDPLESIPLSALQHWCYCQRQWALIHVEQVFEENIHTQRGQALHKRVDDPGMELRHGLRVERALPLFSYRLGLVGKADVVEFLSDGTPYPVEYKHGSRHKRSDIAACDDIQLAGQAMCLEEMTGRAVAEGALFYASSRRRRTVMIDQALRQHLENTVVEVRAQLASGNLPPPRNDERCNGCSLKDICQPQALTDKLGRETLFQALFDPES